MSDELPRDPNWYLTRPYPVIVESAMYDGASCFLARHPDLRGCMGYGSTREEAVANLAEMRELHIRTMLETGLRPPLPAAGAVGATRTGRG